MATRSSILAWEISWTEEPGRLLSAGLQSQTRLTKQQQLEGKQNAVTESGGEEGCLLTETFVVCDRAGKRFL